MVSFDAIVLAAGFSERMGTHKAMLPFGNNRTFIEQITGIYLEAGVKKLVWVTNPAISDTIQTLLIGQMSRVDVVENNEPEKGRLHSIKLGLEKLEKHPLFIQNVDNPFVTVDLIQNLAKAIQPNAYVSPCFHGSGGHPILIAFEIAQALKSCATDIPLHSFLARFEQIKLEQSNANILVNINTPDDYRFNFK